MKIITLILALGGWLALLACSEPPHQLKSLVVEFPEPTMAQVAIESDRSEFQYLIPVQELDQPELLEQRLDDLPESLMPEVLKMLAAVEQPPSLASNELTDSMQALERLLNSLGEDVAKLKDELTQKAEQKASGVAAKIQRQYVEHLVQMLEQDKLSEEEVKLLENALIERHRRLQN